MVLKGVLVFFLLLLALARVLAVALVRERVEVVEVEPVRELQEKVNAAHRVPVLVQRRRERADAHDVRDHHEYATRDPGLRRETDLERELTRIIVHAAAVHHAQAVLSSYADDQYNTCECVNKSPSS